jgi:PUA domain protein
MGERPKVRVLKSREKDGLQPLIKQLIQDDVEAKKLLKGEVKILEYVNFTAYLLDDYILVNSGGGKTYPALLPVNEKLLNLMPTAVVDMGAVRPVASGADIMRPGIRFFRGSFKAGDLVVVRDERHSKPLAVGMALTSYEEAVEARTGKVLKNIHHVDDKVWRVLVAEVSKPR